MVDRLPDETWVITSYQDGKVQPMRDAFVHEEDALETWDKWMNDPGVRLVSLKKETTMRRGRGYGHG